MKLVIFESYRVDRRLRSELAKKHYRSFLRLYPCSSNRPVWQNGVNADHAVDDLRDAEVNRQACQRNRVQPLDVVEFLDQREHRLQRGVSRIVERVANAERNPC